MRFIFGGIFGKVLTFLILLFFTVLLLKKGYMWEVDHHLISEADVASHVKYLFLGWFVWIVWLLSPTLSKKW